MKHIAILISIVSVACFSFTQTNDTIYIYETVEVYDTVFVYDTVYRNIEIDKIQAKDASYSLLQIDTLNKKANILIISSEQTATLPIHNIMINEHIKTYDDMKKINFLGVLMIAAQSMLFAQSDFGISVGSGAWWQSSTREFVEVPPITPMFSSGLFVRQPIIKNNFALKLEVNYSFLISKGKYVYGEEGSGYQQRFYEYNDGINYVSTSFSDLNARYGNNLHNLTIPLSIVWNKNAIQPFFGINYYLLAYNTKEFNASQGLGLHGGIAYKINKNLAFDCAYYFKGYDYGEGGESRTNEKVLLSEHLYLRNNQIRLSLNYTFDNKDQAEIKTK